MEDNMRKRMLYIYIKHSKSTIIKIFLKEKKKKDEIIPD